ncbi:nitrilase-related carbon-nitrogen hydrolase [Streptomyces sp. NPDC004980]
MRNLSESRYVRHAQRRNGDGLAPHQTGGVSHRFGGSLGQVDERHPDPYDATPCRPTSTSSRSNPDTVLIGGGSVIVSPLGEILGGPLRDGESILTAELDLEDLARARFDLDTTGHYARPYIFTPDLDESSRTVVTSG